MASADRRVKNVVFLEAPKEDDLVEGILTGIEDYKAGRVSRFQEQRRAVESPQEPLVQAAFSIQ